MTIRGSRNEQTTATAAHGREGAAPSVAELSGAVLAGGASRRFGRDKAAFRYRGRPLIAHALDCLADVGERLVVSNAPRPESSVRVVADVRPGFGALSGVHAALTHARHPWVAVIGCDMPFVTTRLWPLLLEHAAEVRLVVPEGPEGLQPLAALYHRGLLPEMEEAMAAGGAPLRALAERLPSRVVPWGTLRERLHARTFLNANRPEDLP